ncbi:MAG: PEP-CTERM system histidine kinase PrsK [Deltaproteobacteria bacterium]|nr:PEP-CTERM system histidine kinase PrsK [Deltaproteobacteria bacterium]
MALNLAFLSAISALLCVALGLFTLRKNPGHTANIGFTAGLMCLALMEAGSFLALLAGQGLEFAGMKAVLFGQALMPSAWLLFTSVFGRGDYKNMPATQLYLIIGTSAASLIFCVLLAIPSLSASFISLPSVFSEEASVFPLGAAGKYLYIFLIIGMVINLVQLENTLRSSTGLNRWAIKYLVFGVGSILAFFIYMSTQYLLFSAIDSGVFPVKSAVIIISVSMMALFIVKYRLLDVDIFVSRYFIYNSITVLTVGLYLLAVGLVTYGIRYFQLPYGSFFSAVFVFISILTLVVLLSAAALRRKAQLFINRNFYKHKYEFRDKWMETVEKITPLRSVAEVSETFVDIISETMFPSSIHLWVFDPVSKTFVLSSSRSSAPVGAGKLSADDPFIAVIEETLSPFSASELKDGPARSLFEKTGAVLCSPLVAGKEIIGFCLLGPDRAGAEYIQDDNELLKAISTQSAVQIREIKLLGELTATKEMEAFSKMSSFIMHDLKNLTNSLSLISQNAQDNMDNPEFQRDTIRTIDGTVSRMKKVIGRLSNMPKELSLRTQIMDVDDLVEKSLMKLAIPAEKDISFNKSIEECPPVLVDPEAFEMVILNLILNAYDAIQTSGEIRLAACPDGKFVSITVSDNGRGMSEEYVRTSLFRPFKSTKANGLGIGLYQCKSIVEAHGGFIEVNSSPGAGTSFSVKLPAYSTAAKE